MNYSKTVCSKQQQQNLIKFFFYREKRKNLDGEIFDLLFSLTDFMEFKMMILDYKADKEGKYFDLSQGITVTKI